MGRFDVSLKTVLRHGKTRVLRSLGISGDYTELSPDFPSTRDREVDFLAVVKPARRRPFLAHVELQTASDATMTERMLGCYADIRHWAMSQKELRGLSIRQTVVYVGSRKWRPKTTINEHGLGFTHGFVDARDIDPEPLLDSENLGDVAFAVLCRDGKRPDVIRKVLARIAAAPAPERPDSIATLSVLSDLRRIGPRVQAEMEKMGIPVNLEDSTLIRPTIDRVRPETSINLILRSLRSKFAGQVPAELPEQLEKLTLEELQEAFDRSTTATSVDDVLARIAPRSTVRP